MSPNCLYCKAQLTAFIAEARDALKAVDARPGYSFTTETPCCGKSVELGRQDRSIYMAEPGWRNSNNRDDLVIAGPY